METSEDLVELLVAAVCAEATDCDRRFLRDALHALVRLARIEQLVEVQEDFHRASIAASQDYRPHY